MKNLKTLVYVTTALVLLLSLTWPVRADEDIVSGSFTAANVTPNVTTLEIYSDAGLTTVASNLTPQTTYYVKVTAGDANTIDDIDEIEVHLFYDDGSLPDPPTPGVADTQTCAILKWDKDGGGSEWTLSAGSPTSWQLGSCSKPSDMTVSSDDWVFVITVGKVATESPGSDDWDLYAKATDDGGNYEKYTRDKEMWWYGEITANTTTADFGGVTPGTGFADNTNEVGNISMEYISNGDYDQQVKSDATWTGSSNNATFDATGTCDDAQEFSLKAYDADDYNSAVQVDTSGVSTDATGTQTGENGNTVATNTLWLKVASPFVGDTYSGDITYIIANR